MPSSKQMHFFATPHDLEEPVAQLERQCAVSYVDASPLSNSPALYDSFQQIPNMGVAPHTNAIAGHAYLLVPRTTRLKTGMHPHQLSYPESMLFMPGGKWHDDVLLYGKIGTVSLTEFSRNVYNTFARIIRKRFKRTGAYWVGPEALLLGQSGMRLAIGGDSPRDSDLRLR